MTDRCFVNADGELLIVPESGGLLLRTELGALHVTPGEFAVIPRGIRFAVRSCRTRPRAGTSARTTGPASRCPSGARSARTAWPTSGTSSFRSRPTRRGPRPVQVVEKFGGNLWAADYDHSPLDVVGWHGDYVPYKYDLANFMVIGTISFDHPDPVDLHGADLAHRLPRPGQRRLRGVRAALAGRRGHVPAAVVPPQRDERVHGAGPRRLRRQGGRFPARRRQPAQLVQLARARRRDVRARQRGRLAPQKVDDSLAFMFETRWPVVPTQAAMEAPHRQKDYDEVWSGLRPPVPRHRG